MSLAELASQITSRDIALVRTSFARIAPTKDLTADLFYDRLFFIAGELRPLFPADLAEQKRKLMAMLATAVGRLDDLSSVVPAVKALGARHVGYGTQPEHYDVVAEALLWTLQQGLGNAFTSEMKAAWTKVYGVLAAAMQQGAAEATQLRAAE
jgi:hemoglobin-like flavoprotein